mgnify:CR=1 FL=1
MSKFVAFLNVFVFVLTAIMSGITKQELVTILHEKLEEKFQRKFHKLKQQIDHKLAPLQKMVDKVMETAKFIKAKYDDLVKEQKALKLALHTMEAKFYSVAKAHNDLEQYGFRAKHSTNHAILCIIDRIQKAIDDRNYSCGIFLDFSKAFDTINHNILIRKLQHYGVRGLALDWFISYLSNRNQVVNVNGVQSELLSISCGIPQGSVLGPILFLLYINDFHKCSKLFDFHLFADDANLFYENKNI